LKNEKLGLLVDELEKQMGGSLENWINGVSILVNKHKLENWKKNKPLVSSFLYRSTNKAFFRLPWET
jgi:hypothetical protein